MSRSLIPIFLCEMAPLKIIIFVQVNRCDVEDSPTTDIHIPPSPPEEGFVKGDYCIDYDINYQDGDQFRNIKGM